MDSKFTYCLPDQYGKQKTIRTQANSVIFIGANGAGKSRLGAWIEQQNLTKVHRIGAQRSLNFKENISLKSYQESEDLVLYGNATHHGRDKKIFKYGSANEDNYITYFFDDFDNVLSALIAISNNENAEFIAACKTAEEHGTEHPHTPETKVDELHTIWKDIFPQRELIYNDSKFYACDSKRNRDLKYSATKMSDGERSALYFIAQVLAVPQGRTILVDEPELHFHKSLMNRLWLALERYRTDCLFIYITHDTHFAALHINADIYWVKSYTDPNLWNYVKVDEQRLPEELLLDLLGNRKNVLFVEGESGSFDTQLYSMVYKNYYIVPCGSCVQVIARTKAFNNTPILHHCKAYGIIDRDFRSDYEIKNYEQDNIFTIDVAEVENIFIVEEVIGALAKLLGQDEEVAFQRIKEYVVKSRFEKQFYKQVCQAVVSEIKYRLETLHIENSDEVIARDSIDQGLNAISFDDIKKEIEQKFIAIKNSDDYRSVIRVFNEKGIAKSVGHYVSLQDKEYCRTVLGMMRNGSLNMEALIGTYLPSITQIPR